MDRKVLKITQATFLNFGQNSTLFWDAMFWAISESIPFKFKNIFSGNWGFEGEAPCFRIFLTDFDEN